MGIFDKGVDVADFESFKEDVCSRLSTLSDEISRKATDSEEAARTAANNAISIENSIRSKEVEVISALQALESYRDKALSELTSLQENISVGVEKNNELLREISESKKVYEELSGLKDGAKKHVSSISEGFDEISAILLKAKELPGLVENTGKLVEGAEELNTSLQDLLSHSMKKKSEIDELHKEICGHDVKSSSGEVEHVDGLKDELERAYENVSKKTDDLKEELEGLKQEITDSHQAQLIGQLGAFENLVEKSNARIGAVNDQLTALLPGAMAAGLSAAYESKKLEEIESFEKFEKVFAWAIGGLVLVSLIPFAVDIYLLSVKGVDLVKVIKDTPNLIVSILPLYFPILWLAYSTNKKLNLSKRLIEEYTHKAVLGKTFSGLANQIDTLPHESAVKEDLRTRLLFNVLQVSAENPGKLITNYEKSDHPLMEALENSAKLSESVEVLSKIPGFSSLARKLSQKSEDILKEQERRVDVGLAAQESLDRSDGVSSDRG